MAIKDKWQIRIYKDYSEAARAFRNYFLKYPYNEDVINIALKKDYCAKFKNEVENNLINLNTDQEAYLYDIYYQTICPLILHFKAAAQFYQGDRNEPLYIKFKNCYLHGLGLLAEGIRVLALQKGYDLKLVREVNPSDYELGTTNYIPLIEKGKKVLQNVTQDLGSHPSLNNEPKFIFYLNEKGQKIFPFLHKHFSGYSSKRIAIALYALDDLELLRYKIDKIENKTRLHNALKSSFPNSDVGSRQALSNNILMLNKASASEEIEISEEIERIKKLLKRVAM